MFSRFFVFIFYSVACSVIKKGSADVTRNTLMMGVDAIHEIKIDKNTIFTRNLGINPPKTVTKNAIETSPKENDEPDWVYASIPDEVVAHAEDFKRNMTECLKEVQAREKMPVKRLSPKNDSPVHGECLIACVLKRNQVIENGKINKKNLLTLVGKFYAKSTKVMKKLEKNLDRCVEMSVKSHDECHLAALLNDCTNQLMANNKHKITLNY